VAALLNIQDYSAMLGEFITTAMVLVSVPTVYGPKLTILLARQMLSRYFQCS
jgi:hypothetical protein